MSMSLRVVLVGWITGLIVGFGVGSFVRFAWSLDPVLSIYIATCGSALSCVAVAGAAFRSSP